MLILKVLKIKSHLLILMAKHKEEKSLHWKELYEYSKTVRALFIFLIWYPHTHTMAFFIFIKVSDT